MAGQRVVVLNRDLYSGELHKGDRLTIKGTTEELWGYRRHLDDCQILQY